MAALRLGTEVISVQVLLGPEEMSTSCADVITSNVTDNVTSNVTSNVTGNVTDQMAANVSMITLWLVGICLIWLSKHIKENCVSTCLLRYNLLITSIYLGQ